GDSIAVSGPCLTVVDLEGGGFTADVSVETWDRTAFREIAAGDRVNLEKALLPTTRLGGHLVSGHVDGVAVLRERRPEGRSERFVLEAPAGLARYVAEKGSVCLDGVSLTVNGVAGSRFDVNLVPHTLEATALGERRPGDPLNLEVDLIARYLERLVQGGKTSAAGGGLDGGSLDRAGFGTLDEGG
ncbi:MAG: riboflavin synthase, partial [Gemmatimonadetes bacterium]|nr:riboflavin synthase [Gemmatimonadota bacterium]NIX47626.1 riboflavin synthase [Gemmatimonadota bacterium]NIY11987.1 riboflavin synthase [Gemmatimonadota bacterium]